MAINLQVYSNANAKSKTITADFVAGILADSRNGVSQDTQYYLKLSTTARTTQSTFLPIKIGRGLDDLALDGNVQSAANVSADYIDLRSMIVDYAYDFINGHNADQWASGVEKQYPIDFSR